jgi:hypothetical protein
MVEFQFRSCPTLGEGVVSGKLLCLISAAALLSSIAATSAREPVRLTADQLDKITAGSDLNQMPLVESLLVNGSNGPGGVNQFSPSIATLVPTITNLNLCVFCVTTTTPK